MRRSFGSSSSTSSSSLVFAVLLTLLSCIRAQDRTSETGEAHILDPRAECTPYPYALVSQHINSFPTVWQPAFILQGDTLAEEKWGSIASSIPANIPIKGTVAGNFTNFTPTYNPADPDCWWTYHQCVTPKLAGLPDDIASVAEPNTLGYGFDDGPNCSHNAFYDYLYEQNQKATMFYVGSNVMDWPLEAQRGLADGHEICVHTWSHRYMTALSSEDAFAELYYTMKAIKLVVGVTPTCWRPPFGDVDDRIRAIANGLGLRTIIWKYDSNDWKAGSGNITEASVDSAYNAFIAMAENGTFSTAGAVMLTHELNNFTMSEAIRFYPKLRAAFKHIVPMGVSQNITQPYAEKAFSLPTYQQYTDRAVTTTASGPASTSSRGPASGKVGQLAGAAPGGARAVPRWMLVGAALLLAGAVDAL